jgi:CobQ-like glutamine amidotransferase family enzyme
MTENAQNLVIEALMPYKDILAERIEGGTVFLATGNALEIFGQFIQNEDGSRSPAWLI